MSGETGTLRIQNTKFNPEAFKRDDEGELVKSGVMDFGKGVKAQLALLDSSGAHEIAYFIFDTDHWNEEDAQKWVEKSEFEEKACFNCVEFFEDGNIWVKGIITHMNEKFEPDGREIFGLDIPEDSDIPIRDYHTKGFGKVLGLTRKEWINVQDNVVKFKWNVTNTEAKNLLRAAKNPKKVFKYSPELSNPVRIGHKRAGLLSGIAATDRPAFPGAETTEVLFEVLGEEDREEYFESKKTEVFSMGENDTETMELRLQIKDLERDRDKALEKFESAVEDKNTQKENFESQIEQFEKDIETLTGERDDYKEKFEQKTKDYDDLKKDNDALAERVEKFEGQEKQRIVDEVFELGQKAKLEGYGADNEEAQKKELFELSDDRLDEKRGMLKIMVSKTPGKDATGIGGRGQENFENQDEGKSTKSIFKGMF